jgi:hypothetical protein
MVDNGITNSFEAMREELEKAGYRISQRVIKDEQTWVSYIVYYPNTGMFDPYTEKNYRVDKSLEDTLEQATNDGIEFAHKHLQEKRRAAELEAFIRELATFPRTSDAYNQFYKFQERAKKLLGKQD